MGVFASIFKPSYRSSQKKERVMQNVSVENARWIGALLAELTDEQLRDAFRVANYDKQTMDGYRSVVTPSSNFNAWPYCLMLQQQPEDLN
jgi:uncharacterized protein YbgA (DUF1722 family)